MSLHYRINDKYDMKNSGRGEVQVYTTEVPTEEAKLAMSCIERWGMVAGMPDGEDSSGRAKLGLMPPDELVERAFDVAHLAFSEMRKRQLVLNVPTLDEADNIVANRRAAAEHH